MCVLGNFPPRFNNIFVASPKNAIEINAIESNITIKKLIMLPQLNE